MIWDNEGNLANLIFQEGDEGLVFGIDQGVTCLHPVVRKVGLENYLQRVKELIRCIVNNPDKECPQVKKVRDLILAFTGKYYQFF